MRMTIKKLIMATLVASCVIAASAGAVEIRFQKVADGVYAHIGDTGARTVDYLVALRAHMKRAVDEGTDIGEAVRSFDAKPYMRLLNAAELLPGNANRAYLELERE